MLISGQLHSKLDERAAAVQFSQLASLVSEGGGAYDGGRIETSAAPAMIGGAHLVTSGGLGSKPSTAGAYRAASAGTRRTPVVGRHPSAVSVSIPGGKGMVRPSSATSLARPGSAASLSASMPALVLGDASIENRVRELERSLAPASALELRLSTLERAARSAASHLPKDVWGKLWNAVNRLQYRIQVLEHSAGRGVYAHRLSEMMGEAAPASSARRTTTAPGMTQLRGSGGGSAGAFEAAAASPPALLMDEHSDLLSATLSGGSGGRLAGNAKRGGGSGSRQGDALIAALPGLMHDPESSMEGSPMPSQHSTRPPSASCRPTSAASSIAGVSRTAPSITPLDGGGGMPGLTNDFHVGVVQAGHGGGGNTAVSWQS